MKRIGIISDTHGYWDGKLEEFLAECHEVWHAGDIGSIATADSIAAFKPLRAVHGNIDDSLVRRAYPAHLGFKCEGVEVFITHIGGYPGNYERSARALIELRKPKLFVCGHSHILKVIFDQKYQMLHVNPGAAGNRGIHKVRTAVRLTIDGEDMTGMEVIDIPRGV